LLLLFKNARVLTQTTIRIEATIHPVTMTTSFRREIDRGHTLRGPLRSTQCGKVCRQLANDVTKNQINLSIFWQKP
jgi:hypothetical protein